MSLVRSLPPLPALTSPRKGDSSDERNDKIEDLFLSGPTLSLFYA